MELIDKKVNNSSIKMGRRIVANYILLELDSRANILFLNGYGERIFGLKLCDIQGKNIIGTIVERKDDVFVKKIKEIINQAEIPFDGYFEYEHNKNNGDKVNVSWVFSLNYADDTILEKIVCIGTNITKNTLILKDNLSSFRHDILIEERNRLANEIHDTASQTLFSLNILCSNLKRLWEKGKKDKFYSSIENIEKLGNVVFSELRVLLYELKPQQIENESLKTLIKRIVDTYLSKTQISCSIITHML